MEICNKRYTGVSYNYVKIIRDNLFNQMKRNNLGEREQ